MNEIINQTVQSVLDSADSSRVKFNETMVPTGLKVVGVKSDDGKKILKELREKTKNYSSKEKIDIAKGLIDTGILECCLTAYDYIGNDKLVMNEIKKSDITYMNKNLDNWASVDCFGLYIHGKAWRMGILSDEDIIHLSGEKDFWQRRLGIVSTIALNQKSRGGTGDPQRTLKICAMMVNDHHDMIVKALSWALRELGKIEPEIVKEFLDKNEHQLHKRVLREVRNKIFYGKKNI